MARKPNTNIRLNEIESSKDMSHIAFSNVIYGFLSPYKDQSIITSAAPQIPKLCCKHSGFLAQFCKLLLFSIAIFSTK